MKKAIIISLLFGLAIGYSINKTKIVEVTKEVPKIVAGVCPVVSECPKISFGGTTNAFDCKGTDCQVQVMVKKSQFNDAIYYKPAEWNAKTATDIDNDETARYDKWKTLVDEQSKKATTTDEILP